MIRVICTHEGYLKAGIAWSCLPTFCEEGFLSEAQIKTLTDSQLTPNSPKNRIVIDFDMPEPEGEGWKIHRATDETRAVRKAEAAKSAKAEIPAPVIASPAPVEPPEKQRAKPGPKPKASAA